MPRKCGVFYLKSSRCWFLHLKATLRLDFLKINFFFNNVLKVTLRKPAGFDLRKTFMITCEDLVYKFYPFL